MGTLSAYLLQQRLDANVKLYDQAPLPVQNASYMAGGMLAPLSELDHMPESYLDAGFSSIKIWEEISKELQDSFEFSSQGSMFLTHEADRYLLERFQTILPHDNRWQRINAQDIQDKEPALPRDHFRHALFMEGEAHLHPRKALLALQSAIGQTVQEKADPNTIISEHDWVIDARGMGAVPRENLRGVKGETVLVHNADFNLSRPLRLMHPRYPLYIIPREGNIFLIGATIIESDDEEHMNVRSALELMSALYSLHPSFGDAKIIETGAGIRPAYTDNLPHIAKNNRIITANGLFRHGFLFAPVMAQCIADIISGATNSFTPLFMKDQNDEHHPKWRAA